MSPTKSSIVPLARFKRLTIDLLYRNSLELATFRAEKHIQLGFCNPQLYYLNRLVMQDMAGCLPLHDKKGRALARPEVTPTGFKPVTF